MADSLTDHHQSLRNQIIKYAYKIQRLPELIRQPFLLFGIQNLMVLYCNNQHGYFDYIYSFQDTISILIDIMIFTIDKVIKLLTVCIFTICL